jgi:hypothetical protein
MICLSCNVRQLVFDDPWQLKRVQAVAQLLKSGHSLRVRLRQAFTGSNGVRGPS